MSKMEFSASDKKLGMTLDELKNAVEKFVGFANINETNIDQSRVFVQINFSGGIKAITAEV
jgi:hypothetical protein